MSDVVDRGIGDSVKRRLWSICLVVGVLFATAVTPAIAKEDGQDPVVLDVIEMLQAGVDEGVIEQWLASTDRRPADIERRDLIALTEAGASESLMTTLLKIVEEQTETTVATPAEVDRDSSPSGDSSLPAPAGVVDPVETAIQLRAKQAFVDEDEPDSPRPQAWWVYLYLDGELVAWAKPSIKGEPVESRRLIAAGQRELRVVLQRYEELRGGWHYESLSVPILVTFEAGPGDHLEIEVEMKRVWGLWRDRKDGGPLSYIIRQGVEILAEQQGTGGNPDRWQPVCEDVEANFPGAQEAPKRFRRSMERCIRWADLWTGSGRETLRTEILALLSEDDFEPPVR